MTKTKRARIANQIIQMMKLICVEQPEENGRAGTYRVLDAGSVQFILRRSANNSQDTLKIRCSSTFLKRHKKFNVLNPKREYIVYSSNSLLQSEANRDSLSLLGHAWRYASKKMRLEVSE